MTSSDIQPRRKTVIASGLLCGVLALVVLFTNKSAFFSPLAVVVVAAIGLIAVLLQSRFRDQGPSRGWRSPVWLNALGILFAVAALFADHIGLPSEVAPVMALVAIGTFAISSAIILAAFRKRRSASESSTNSK
ncbi:MAG: hypothetical protein M3O09_01990 [Acidobacteriota bacterium]|nr:hypothetical protein [Acidobacteriota bacterium]